MGIDRIDFCGCPFDHLKSRFFSKERKHKPINPQHLHGAINGIFPFWSRTESVTVTRTYNVKAKKVIRKEKVNCSCVARFNVLSLLPDDLEEVVFERQPNEKGSRVVCRGEMCTAIMQASDYIREQFKEIIIPEKTS